MTRLASDGCAWCSPAPMCGWTAAGGASWMAAGGAAPTPRGTALPRPTAALARSWAMPSATAALIAAICSGDRLISRLLFVQELHTDFVPHGDPFLLTGGAGQVQS